MRLAILADIHGNIAALDAVLKDIDSQGGVDATWILGDLVEGGPAPVAVLERIAALKNTTCIRGNTDRWVCAGTDRFNMAGDAPALALDVEAAGTVAWTQGAITQAGWFEWLNRLALDVTLILPDGTKILGVHASPGCDTGLGFHPDLQPDEFKYVVGGCDADVILVGHTHRALDVTINGQRLVNLGSVSLPYPPDLRASYVILSANAEEYHIELRRVDYDREAVIAAVEKLRHPGVDYIRKFLRGQRQASGRDYVERHLARLQNQSSTGQ
jgi:predicted phosphodiesterase